MGLLLYESLALGVYATLKVYFPHDKRISIAMERVRQGLIKHRPANAEFVDKPSADTVHVINWIGQNPKEHTARDELTMAVPTLPKSPKYILILHGAGNPHYPQFDKEWHSLLKNAMLIITFYKGYADGIGNVYETSWGYDPAIFHNLKGRRFRKILCTGYIAAMESIDSILDACKKLGVKALHVGGPLGAEYHTSKVFIHFWNISDEHMCKLYNECEYVSGMRKGGLFGGFELPNIEGYACGCQPICHTNPISVKYFKDFAIYIPELPRKELADRLVEILKEPAHIEPKQEILERFKWENIAPKIWQQIMEC